VKAAPDYASAPGFNRAESDGTFVIGNIVPGKYWLVARQNEEREAAGVKPIRRNSNLRSIVLREAEKLTEPQAGLRDGQSSLSISHTARFGRARAYDKRQFVVESD
jgi:hypothetical protein